MSSMLSVCEVHLTLLLVHATWVDGWMEGVDPFLLLLPPQPCLLNLPINLVLPKAETLQGK